MNIMRLSRQIGSTWVIRHTSRVASFAEWIFKPRNAEQIQDAAIRDGGVCINPGSVKKKMFRLNLILDIFFFYHTWYSNLFVNNTIARKENLENDLLRIAKTVSAIVAGKIVLLVQVNIWISFR